MGLGRLWGSHYTSLNLSFQAAPVPEALPCSRRGTAEATQPQREGDGGRCIRGHTQKPRATVLCPQFL